MPTPQQLLKRYWGFERFRHGQLEIIKAAASGEDVLALLPTGGGKSICYQVAGLKRGGLTLVISPLIALMADQVAQLTQRGLKAAFVNSSLPPAEQLQILDNATRGEYQFLYVAPERLLTTEFQARLPYLNVKLLAIDEAHCISQWGHQFRPNYRRLAEFREQLPAIPTMALTATATPEVQDDIITQLQLYDAFRYLGSFERPNLRFAVLYERPAIDRVVEVIRSIGGSGILYVRSRQGTETLAQQLSVKGIPAQAYHAGLKPHLRERVQQAWQHNQTQVVVATNAFGMGIDKPDVRFVLHTEAPPDLESYYQEAGRAGRDGHTAYAVLFHRGEITEKLTQRFKQANPSPKLIQQVYRGLQAELSKRRVYDLSEEQQRNYRLPLRLEQFAKRMRLPIATIHAAIRQLEHAEMLSTEERFAPDYTLQITAQEHYVRQLADEGKPMGQLLENLLRGLGGEIFQRPKQVSPKRLEHIAELSVGELHKLLDALAARGYIQYSRPQIEQFIRFLHPQLASVKQMLSVEELSARQQANHRRLQAMLQYAEDLNSCRSVTLRRYFGDTDATPCGRCDVCTGRHAKQPTNTEEHANIRARLLSVLASTSSINYDDLLKKVSIGAPDACEFVLRELIREERAALNYKGEVSLI
ncbi:MAG: RecQ family ATP-dependent DNA helicase [Bacteroidota bacterium]